MDVRHEAGVRQTYKPDTGAAHVGREYARTGVRMRILLTTDYYPPHYGGGAEATLPVVVHSLAQLGHSVEVITLNTRNAKPVEERDGAVVHRVPTWPLERILGLQFSFSPSLPLFVSRRVRQFRPDIIWAHNHFFTTSLAGHWASLGCGTPVLTDLSVADVGNLPRRQRMFALGWEKTLSRWMLRRSVALTGVSQACIDHAKKLIGRKPVPVFVVPNGVNRSKFRPPNSPNQSVTVGFVGRLIQNKGPQRLVDAIPKVLASHPSVRFVFIGDGPLKATLQSRVKVLGASHAVEFKGSITHEKMPDALRTLNIVVRPSDTEGLPVILLESMATGIPVIATDVGGTREVLQHEVTGILLAPNPAPHDISHAVNSLVGDRERLDRLGRTARKASERVDWRHCIGLREEVLLRFGKLGTNGRSH